MPTAVQPQLIAFFTTVNPECGWSEIYYPAATDIETAISGWISHVLPARLGIMPADVNIVYIRCSDVNVKGDSILDTSTHIGTWSGSSNVNDARLSLLIRQRNEFNQRAMKYIHGIPTDQFTLGVYTPTTPFGTAFNVFKSAVIANCLHANKNPTPPPKLVLSTIVDFGVVRLTTRRVGRPFGLPVGRRMIA
jgi:hypothetical protein